MGELVPEKRLNRLGQWVTKHVRRDGIRQSDGAARIPVPAVPAAGAVRTASELPEGPLTEREAAELRVLRKGRAAHLKTGDCLLLSEIVRHADPRFIPEDFSPRTLLDGYRALRSSQSLGSLFSPEQAAEGAVMFIAQSPESWAHYLLRPVIDFVRAGIPAEIAIDVLRAGGTVQQAEAVRDRDVAPSLSSGAL